ncbi:tub-1 [Symbiodinium sp. KB8]|nr:tub-1 [Symbiodinium sp. KB8]
MRHLDLVVHAADKESWCSCRVSSGKACTRAWPQDGDAFVEELPCRPAQAKNFQLALRQKPQHVICQYGKLGPTNFGLDFRYPMSVIQAFGAAMSTLFWT